MADRTPDRRDGVSRRQFIRTTAIAAGGIFAVAGLSESATAAAKKFSQQQAHYQSVPKNGQRCQNCSLFQPPNACQVVEGPVSPAGWCMLYQPKA